MASAAYRLMRAAVLLAIAGMANGAAQAGMTISSPAFADGQPMPAKYARASGNVSPPLQISGVPTSTKSLVLIVEDPDAPATGLWAWTHWLVWNIEPDTTKIDEGKVPAGAVQGRNSFGAARYDGPQPPSGTHRYYFHLYALRQPIHLPSGADRDLLMGAMAGKIIQNTEFHGTYSAGG